VVGFLFNSLIYNAFYRTPARTYVFGAWSVPQQRKMLRRESQSGVSFAALQRDQNVRRERMRVTGDGAPKLVR
jgi:hypothetical protein